MNERELSTVDCTDDDTAIDLPLVNIDKRDVLGELFVHTDNSSELYRDALLKLQTWIVNFAEEQITPLRESGCFTEDELEQFKKKIGVISPLTLAMYIHWLQMDVFSKLPDSEKEKRLLAKLPDQFKARYKGNAACRNARDVSPDEEHASGEGDMEDSDSAVRNAGSLIDFMRLLGGQMKECKTITDWSVSHGGHGQHKP